MRTGELRLYDLIGEGWFGGISAKQFAEDLAALELEAGDELTIRVNSPGGSVFDGLAIYNQLKQHPATKIVKVEGLAASAASFIIQAADQVEVAEASFVMIHRAWFVTIGDADDHLKSAALLEQNDGVIADIYAKRSKKPAAEWTEAMSAETWYTGPEAVEAGLADRLIPETSEEAEPEEQAAAALSRAHVLSFRNVPAALRQRATAAPSQRSPIHELTRIAALVHNEGKVLNAANRKRLNDIRSLAQEVLDSAEPKEEPTEAAALTELRGDLAVMRGRLNGQQVEIDSIRAIAGLRKE